MPNDAIGSVLVIPDSVLKKMDDADKKLARLQDTINKTGNVAATSFRNMANGVYGFSTALDAIIAKLKTVETSSANASAAFNNMKGGNLANAAAQAEKLGASITRAAENIDRLNNKGNTSPLTASAKQYEAIIERLAGIETQLYNKNERLRANDARRAEEAAERKARAAERAAEREAKAAEKAAAAEEKARERQQRAQAKAYQQQNYARNTTYSGALSFAEDANTINRRAQAVKYLQAARASLSTTDSEYASKLNTLNARIKELNAANNAAIAGSKNLVNEHRKLLDTTGQLSRAFALVFSVSQIKGYIESIANVRGEFEMSQRSLEAILQNKTQADQIFAQTVELAVKSPYRIKDLVSYTRQLAAYRIESDKLFDTTKRLADVSAGLGVDMSRLILAYGQVKAAAYLRGSEVRQFTEAGVNMYGELQRYFQEVKGEAYTTAQIVDMISKRMVTFQDVEAVFQRMTDKGGLFYNMQEIQSETLQGKISNFKDSIDVMLNSIGKANESTFKGAIDTATELLEHWQEIVNIGKALVGVFILLKLHSIRTGNALKTVFTANFVANGTKTVATTNLLVSGFKKAGSAALMFGRNLKAAFMTNLPVAALMVAFELAMTVVDKWNEYNKRVKEAQEEAIKLRGEIGKISSEYDDLTKTSTTANEKDMQKSIDKRRAALQKLIDSAAKEGLVFKINVEDVNDGDLDRTFEEIKKKYKNFVDELEIIKRNYAKNNNWNTWFTDGLDDDAEDYDDAVIDVLSLSSKLEQAIALVNANYDKATSSTKKYFDEIRAGQKDGESNLDYMRRMTEALININELSTGGGYISPQWLKDANASIISLGQGFREIQDAGKDLTEEFDAVFGDLREKYKGDPVLIKAVIDKTAAENDWSQYERDLAYRHFGINVTINKDSVEQEVSWIDDYLSDFFAKKKYGVSLVVNEITNDKALDSFIKKGDDAAKAARNWQELEKRMSAIGKNVRQIKIDDTIRTLFKDDLSSLQDYIDVSTLKDLIAKYKQAATETSKSLGVDPFSKENAKRAKSASKQQRDILQERISLLKEMQQEYEKLAKLESSEDAISEVKRNYADALKYVKMPDSIVSSFVPTKQGLKKALEQLLPTIKDFKKKAEVLKDIGQLDIEIRTDNLQKELEAASKEADRILSNLDLYRKLKEQGLDDGAIQRMFGNLTMSFEDARKQLDALYADKQGGKWTKQKEEQFDKLTKKINDFNLAQTQDIIKDYGKQLDERLKLDLWYVNERAKIERDANLTSDLKAEYRQTLDNRYSEKAAKLEWEQFKNTDTYIEMFNNLDNVSSHMLERMKEQLEALKASLKDLSPEQLKTIQEQINKIDDEIQERNPLKGFGKNLKEWFNAAKETRKLEKAFDSENEKLKELESNLKDAADEVKKLKEQYDSLTDDQKRGVVGNTLNFMLEDAKKQYDDINKEVGEQQEKVDGVAKELNRWRELLSDLAGQFEYIGQWFDSISSGITEIASNLESVFGTMSDGTRDTIESISEISGGLGQTASGIGGLISSGGLNPAAWVSTIGGITKTIGSIFNIGDKKKERQIQRMAEQVENLQHAYENLEQAQADAWSITDLDEYTEKLKKNLEMQNANLRAMIAAEEDKKKTDNDRIKEWQQQIEENEKAIKEAQESLVESLGGFGSEANYKSAAQSFADAWVDAFNEGSDTLAALEDQFDELFDNILKKQVSTRVADKIVNSLLKPLDDALVNYDGSSSSLQSLRQSLEKIREESPETLKAFDEAMKAIADTLGFDFGAGADAESNLSALQQGIQGVTEQTAEALEALLNSIRFFVAKQTEDIAAIRALLSGSQAIDVSTSDNPMVTILREQAGYLKNMLSIMTDMWNQAFAPGHPKGGRGLKVFM